MNEAERFLYQMQRDAERTGKHSQKAHLAALPPRYKQNAFCVQRAAKVPSCGRQVKVGFWEVYRRYWTRWTCDGRASRSEYWWAILANQLVGVIGFFCLGFVLGVAGVQGRRSKLCVRGSGASGAWQIPCWVCL